MKIILFVVGQVGDALAKEFRTKALQTLDDIDPKVFPSVAKMKKFLASASIEHLVDIMAAAVGVTDAHLQITTSITGS